MKQIDLVFCFIIHKYMGNCFIIWIFQYWLVYFMYHLLFHNVRKEMLIFLFSPFSKLKLFTIHTKNTLLMILVYVFYMCIILLWWVRSIKIIYMLLTRLPPLLLIVASNSNRRSFVKPKGRQISHLSPLAPPPNFLLSFVSTAW